MPNDPVSEAKKTVSTPVGKPIFDPGAPMPFLTYRCFSGEDEEPLFDLAPTLVHHYESEKFRGVNEGLRIEVLDASTARAALKVAKRHKDQWRKDWKQVRSRVFRAGLAMQVVQSKSAMAMARQGFAQSMELASTKRRINGLPGTFIADELQTFFQKTTATGVARLGVLALAGCVPDDIEDRLNALFINAKPLSAAVYAGRDADTRIEQWCAQVGIPVRLTSSKSMRLRELDAAELTARINTLVICMPKSRKAPKAILTAAASKRPKIRVIDLTAKTTVKANARYESLLQGIEQ